MQATTAPTWQTGTKELIAKFVAVEKLRRRLDAEMLQVVSELDGRGAGPETGHSSTEALLMSAGRITRQDARCRTTLAKELFGQTTPTGSVIEASLPQTVAALSRGEISTEHVEVIRKTLTGLDDLEPEKLALAEKTLLEQAGDDDPRALARFAPRVRDIVDPDGPPPPPDPDPQPKRWVKTHLRGDGSMELKALLDREDAHRLHGLMQILDKPLPEGDTRGYAERAADAFSDLLRKAANCPDLPTHNGFKTEMALVVSLETLRDATADMVLPGQTDLTVRDARRMACDSHVLPAVMDGDSKPIDVAVPAYVVPAHIRRGLVLRDRGCAFPSCPRPASACDSHHIRSWVKHNGPTKLDNLVLLCGHHHRLIHRSEWTVELIGEWAYFTPPDYIDPAREPRINKLHRLPDSGYQPASPSSAGWWPGVS